MMGYLEFGKLSMKLLKHNIQNIQKCSIFSHFRCVTTSNLLNSNNHGGKIANNPKNIKISHKTSILRLQQSRFSYGNTNFGLCYLVNLDKFGKPLSNCSKDMKISQKTLIPGHQQGRSLNYVSCNLPNLGDSHLNLTKCIKILPQTAILGQQQHRFLYGHRNDGSSKPETLNNLKKTFLNSPKPSILSQQPCRSMKLLIPTLNNSKPTLFNSSKPLILGQQPHRSMKLLIPTLNNSKPTLYNSSKPLILGLQPHRSMKILVPTLNNSGKTLLNFPIPLIFGLQPHRSMKLLEYQGIEMLHSAGVPTGKFAVVRKADEAQKMAASLGVTDFMVKAQVLTGGRGKGKFKNSKISGVKMASSAEEVGEICKKMLDDKLVTVQTGEKGIICNAVLVTERHFPRKELYFAITMDRAHDGPVLIASTQGGMDIEEVAKTDPKAITYQAVDVIQGLKKEDALKIITKLEIKEKPEKLAEILTNLYKLFEKDAILVELNPLALDIHNDYLCLDCKMDFDDSAEFKHPELFKMKDVSQLDARELAAFQQNINYIALSGNIGCMVNGAGLAMATMDIITLHGGEPANFLDVGGGATTKTVETCFEIITSDKNVDCIFVNIFGGIMRCDVIAQGIIAAAQKLNLKHLPIVCRLHGTNVSEAKALIASSDMRILSIDDLDEGAKVAVNVSKIRSLAKGSGLDVDFELIGI